MKKQASNLVIAGLAAAMLTNTAVDFRADGKIDVSEQTPFGIPASGMSQDFVYTPESVIRVVWQDPVFVEISGRS